MPVLHWTGKDKVVKHHLDVPYRVLDEKYRYGNPDSVTDNKIIHGDNLEALKSLLPEYEGRIKCIYIDPPYNTGNESWVYSDNVNHPKIRRWLGEVVGKEGEDLSRHDKWLCMMYPRIKLLHRLLSTDGAIFVSIDDGEFGSLRLLLDEIFGRTNYYATVLWQKKYTSSNDHKGIAPMHDFILVSRKSTDFIRSLLPRTEEKNSQYKHQDSRGVYRVSDYTCNKTVDERPNLYYAIVNPNTDEEVWPKRSRVWAYSEEQHQRHVEEDRIYWGKDGKARVPSLKRYLKELRHGQGIVPNTWWEWSDAGHTDEAKKEIRSILSGRQIDDFITPKPVKLIDRILRIATDSNDIILDSFAGSGTTAHAVLNLNKEDGGNRKFILIELEDYADSITAERVKRVIDGYGDGNSAVEGTGGGFSFYELGEPLFHETGLVNDELDASHLRRYIWFTETGQNESTGTSHSENPSYLGSSDGASYYVVHNAEGTGTLDFDFLGSIDVRDEQYVIYADRCLIDDEVLRKHGIVFKKIPRDIVRF